MNIRPRQRDRLQTNPAFSTRRLKLGTFQTNLDSGCVMSDLEGRLDITWPNTVALAKLAEEMEFEALVPVARWQGWGGKTNPQGPGFEAYTWAAGISASTKTAGVVSTSHITINHPIIAAKQSAVVDHISNGRFTLNIVTGWVQPEIEMFNQPMLSHEERYACAEEWLAIIKRLWTEDESFDHEGRFYKIVKGYLAPKPIQFPYPAIMNAGASERGRHFAAKHCDLVYTVIRTGGLDECRAHVQAYHKLARELWPRHPGLDSVPTSCKAKPRKKPGTSTITTSTSRATGKRRKTMVETFSLDINQRNVPPERIKPLQEAFIQGWGGLPVVGTKEQVVDALDHAVTRRPRRRAGGVPALRGGHAPVPRRDLSAAEAGGADEILA